MRLPQIETIIYYQTLGAIFVICFVTVGQRQPSAGAMCFRIASMTWAL